jgi:DNA-binding transcriptional LysR family regulator
VTPTQLRAFAAVVRLGSVKRAAADLRVSEAAVSLHVGQLRKELGDKLFVRTGSGLAFTPGGLRLASRAAELLGLQDRTIMEVRQAGGARRLLRIATSALFGEYSAPGLIGLFGDRADDLDVELSVHNPSQFDNLLLTRTVDVVIGPRSPSADPAVVSTVFLNYQVVTVASPDLPLSRVQPSLAELRGTPWLLGPSVAEGSGVVPVMMRRLGIPEHRQQIFQSHAAAVEETKRGRGIAPVLAFAAAHDLAHGDLVRLPGQSLTAGGAWSIAALAGDQEPSAAAELIRFVSTPRAIQAMLRGSGVSPGRFKPSIHVTLWN